MKKVINIYLTVLLCIVKYSFAGTIIVDVSGNGDFIDIQSAIYSAVDGDTVFVKNGVYNRFGIPSVEITIIGESKDSTKIGIREGVCFISTEKRCEIRNLRFIEINPVVEEGIYIDSYNYYDSNKLIPELIIRDCIFDGGENGNSTIGISLGFDFLEMSADGVIDTFLNRIKIINNSFINVKRSIEFLSHNILLKKLSKTSNVSPINFNCSDRYFGVFDSLGIDSLVYDDRDLLSINLQGYLENFGHFNYIPWSDTLITQIYQTFSGIRYNNFINVQTAFYSGVIEPIQTSINEGTHRPEGLDLFGAYPNPFNSIITLKFMLQKPAEVQIKVYTINGKEISNMMSRKNYGAGQNQYKLNFEYLPSGIYLISINNSDIHHSLKVTHIK